MKYLKIILRILVGSTFILSAILKLLSIDQFELYIYSFGIFNFFLTSVLSRLLITFEFLLGVFLILKFFYSKIWWLTMLTMIGFTLFLIYTAIFRNDSNCHCFGSFIEINSAESIVKNLILIGLLLFVKKQNEWSLKYKKWFVFGFITIGLVVSFIVVPPDSLYNKIYKPHSKVNKEVLNKVLLDSNLVEISREKGNHIVAIFIPGCKFCKMSMKKLENIFKNNNLDNSKLKVIILGDQKKKNQFMLETDSKQFALYPYDQPIYLFNAVYGTFPTILFLRNDTIVNVVNYRGIDESLVLKHINGKNR
jgi:hypothetical protein